MLKRKFKLDKTTKNMYRFQEIRKYLEPKCMESVYISKRIMAVPPQEGEVFVLTFQKENPPKI